MDLDANVPHVAAVSYADAHAATGPTAASRATLVPAADRRLPASEAASPRSARTDEPRLFAAARLPYYLYVPPGFVPGGPLLVTVHGISRNAGEHVRRFAPYAERHGVAVVAPLFEAMRFPRYQRLDADAAGERPDALLEALAAEVAAHTGADAGRLYLFGYSGGGQLVHRYVLAHPGRVARYVVGAAGWYTFPEPGRRYPYGLRHAARRVGGSFCAEEFLAVPGHVLVGERDIAQGTAMRVGDRLIAQQGGSRLERAQRWVGAMNAAARAAGLAPPLSLEVMPRSPHSFARSMRRGKMGERVFGFLFGAEAPESGQGRE